LREKWRGRSEPFSVQFTANRHENIESNTALRIERRNTSISMSKNNDPDLLDEQEPKKKTTRKKAASAATEKGTSAKTAKAPAAKRAPRKKAAAPADEPAPVSEIAAAPEPAAAEPIAEVIPPPVPAPAAPPAAAPAPASDGPKPRPLYIPREVEAFLRAANIPIPTEKTQLDAIMAAMMNARMAAHQATAIAPASPAPQAETGAPAVPSATPAPQRGRHERPDHRQHRRDPQQPEQREPNREPQESAPPVPRAEPELDEIVDCEGYCEISGKGFGFLRDAKRFFQPHPGDVFVTPEAVKKYGLRDGQWLKAEARKSSRGLQIHRILAINDAEPEQAATWPAFDDLTTISPLERMKLETVPDRFTTRIIDLVTPVGKGQRGLIVAPPRTGKTTLLHHMAQAMVKNHPEVKLMILLVDERPEEVTDFKRNIPEAELWASSNDMDVKSHTRIAQLCIERAKRLVESGRDVFILLDSITRLGRAFNNAIAGGGRTMSGGVDSRALEIPRKIFAAARNTEEAGSLTIVATALIETGSRMDELIFQEFKGTGNMEIVLDRKISDQRVYPAIDIFQSGTRRDELLIPSDDLHKISVIRRGLAGHKPFEAIERLLSFVKKFPTNSQLLREIPG
jgi:transcription termination factor Rho